MGKEKYSAACGGLPDLPPAVAHTLMRNGSFYVHPLRFGVRTVFILQCRRQFFAFNRIFDQY
jgi:hypothetical protein